MNDCVCKHLCLLYGALKWHIIISLSVSSQVKLIDTHSFVSLYAGNFLSPHLEHHMAPEPSSVSHRSHFRALKLSMKLFKFFHHSQRVLWEIMTSK